MTEATTTTTEAPKMFICGSGGIVGYYGRVVFKGQVEYVRKQGQWNFDTRQQAEAATRRHARIWRQWEAERATKAA